MPRRRKIPPSVNTPYFSNVTPLWVAPGRRAIPERYHQAVHALAEWAGPSWSDNELTDFFMIRTVVIQSCESWADYNWVLAETQISNRRIDERLRPKFANSVEALATHFGRPGFRRIKRHFFLHLMMEAGIDIPDGLTNGQALQAVERSLRALADSAKHPDALQVRYGSVEYDSLRCRLPAKEVAIALSLADRITFFRKDGHSAGFLDTPHPPNISPNLPWRAIALFASANARCGKVLDESSIQKQVRSLARSVANVYWSERE